MNIHLITDIYNPVAYYYTDRVDPINSIAGTPRLPSLLAAATFIVQYVYDVACCCAIVLASTRVLDN